LVSLHLYGILSMATYIPKLVSFRIGYVANTYYHDGRGKI
jgi:hypothetical protein